LDLGPDRRTAPVQPELSTPTSAGASHSNWSTPTEKSVPTCGSSDTLDDIADEPLPRALDPTWNAFWRVDPRPDGSPAPDGPLVEGTVEDKIELIAGGQAVAIVPACAGINGLRPDLTTIPLEGVEPSHVVVATRAGDRSRLVTDFRRYAETHLTAPDLASPASGPPT
jgi:DNA-binding transcriptional LysR family regulator